MRIGENTTQNYQSILQMLKNLNKNTRNDPLGIFHSNFGMNQTGQGSRPDIDRKSTRLNSSHMA